MMATRLQLARVLIVVARWSIDLNVFFTSGFLCTTLTVDEVLPPSENTCHQNGLKGLYLEF